MPTEPRRTPESYADTRAAWEGSFADAPGIPIRIEAAALRGKPVSFTVMYPWSRSERTPSELTPYDKVISILIFFLIVTFIAGPVFFARQNLRLGRGDRRGASRMVVALAVVPFTLFFLLDEHHVASFWELALFIMSLAGMMFFGGLLWMLYIALEPFVRRRWPQMRVSWTRALSGDWRDPLVGRDVLIGCAAGVAGAVLPRLSILVSLWLGRPEKALLPWGTNNVLVLGTSSFIGQEAFFISFSVILGLGSIFFFLLLRTLLRKDWLAGLVWILVLMVPDPSHLTAAGVWLAVI